MKISFRLIVALSALLVFCSLGLGDPNHDIPPYKGSSALERIKKLDGDWSGTVKHFNGKEDRVKVRYDVTSNGSAVIETIFIGTPMEMTSVYFDQGGKLAMTHYCSVANRPQLKLVKEAEDTISLSYATGEELDPKKDMHIHALDLEIKKDGSIIQSWQGHEGGKKTHATVLMLSRANG